MDKHDFQIRARFRHAIKEAGIPDGARLLVAVSGGCDSVSLLHLCAAEARRDWTVLVGHIDHRLRPDSALDAELAREHARTYGFPARILRIRPERWERLHGESIEAEARRLRRRGLRRIARAAGAGWILLGHTRDDQAETLILNLLRGSGVHGLAGMAACRPPWVRPLLQVSRGEVRDYALRHNLRWRDDPTNEDPRFLRNRIRLTLLPLLEREFRPGTAKVLARTSETMRRLRSFLRAEADRAWERSCLEAGPAWIRLDRSQLASYHRAVVEEVLRSAFRRLRGTARDIKQGQLCALARALRSGRPGSFRFPAGIEAVLSRQELRLMHLSRQTGEQ